MKVRRPFLVIMLVALLLSCSVVFGTPNVSYRTYVQLPADMNEVTSTSHAGNFGKGTIQNLSGSAGDAKLLLQCSTGEGFVTLTSFSVSPGGFDQSNIWGLGDTDFLFRVVVQSDPKVYLGNPGRIAYGYLYTGFEN